MVSGKIMAYASPDSTYAVTKKLLDSAQHSIVIGIYDFSADYMKEHLKKAMRRGVTVSLMLDTNTADDPTLFDELERLGANCVKAPSSLGRQSDRLFRQRAREDHRRRRRDRDDPERQLVGEQHSVQRGRRRRRRAFRAGNRDMGLAVHSPELAGFFAELVARDMRLAQGSRRMPRRPRSLRGDRLAGERHLLRGRSAGASRSGCSPASPSRLRRRCAITPVVTPENFHETVKAFLRSAKRSIRIEQQYIRGGQPAVEALLAGDRRRARRQSRHLDVRIIVSPKYLYGNNKDEVPQGDGRLRPRVR